jgi:hypothetical protein
MKPYLDVEINSYQIPWNNYKIMNYVASVDYRRPAFQDFDVKDGRVTLFKNTSTFNKKSLKTHFYCYFREDRHVNEHKLFNRRDHFEKTLSVQYYLKPIDLAGLFSRMSLHIENPSRSVDQKALKYTGSVGIQSFFILSFLSPNECGFTLKLPIAKRITLSPLKNCDISKSFSM